MSIPFKPLDFNPSPKAARAFRSLFNDWRVTPLQNIDSGGDIHATWKRGSNDFHITTQLPGGIRIHDHFDID